MIENAISKINTEMEQNKDNAYVQVIGGFLLQHLIARPEDAEKILNADKTIIKSLDEMRKEAQKKKVGNCAVLTDQEGFSIVLKYFGIETAGEINTASADIKPAAAEKKSEVDFDIKLEDLL